MHAQPTMPGGEKARRVYLQLRADILSGGAGARLPGEHGMASAYGVSRGAVRRALDALVAEGLVERRAGSGTHVRPAPAPQRMAADLASLIPQIVAMGQHSVRLLSFAYEVPPAQVARAMGGAPGARMQRAVRVRSAEGRPFSHLTTWVPQDIAASYSEVDLAAMPLHALLERSGITVTGAEQVVTATLAAPDVAEALETAPGAALLEVDRVVRGAGGRAVEHLRALYRPDRFQLQMQLARVGTGEARHWRPIVGERGDAG